MLEFIIAKSGLNFVTSKVTDCILAGYSMQPLRLQVASLEVAVFIVD